MHSSRAAQLILDATLCSDGVWRVVPASANQARSQTGLDPVPCLTIGDLEFVDLVDFPWERIAKAFWRDYPFTTGY